MRALAIVASMLVPQVAAAQSAPAASSTSDPPQRDAGFYIMLGALAVNTAFTICDVATIGELKPDIYGFGEAVLGAPQALVWGSIAVIVDDEDTWVPAALALWSAGIAAHGIYTIAADRDDSASSRTVMLSFGSRF